MYGRSAQVYDALYASKDYAGEAAQLHIIIQQSCPGAASLLDVACGTGKHVAHLRAHYRVEGLDINPDLLALAQEQNPGIAFHQGDMLSFALEKQFDAVVCLFSAIGYVKTVGKLQGAVATMARHLRPGGVLIIEPWITPQAWRPSTVHSTFVDEPDLKIARLNVSEVDDRVAVMDLHHLVGTPEGVEYFVERHELGLFTHEEYVGAYQDAKLAVAHDAKGLIGRGLYVGVLAK